MATKSINDMIALSPITKGNFISKFNPEKMGNTADIAFGGCVLSMAISAGTHSVPNNYYLYSAQGYYLGPTLASDKVVFVTSFIRDTKTFKTLKVEAKQLQGDKQRSTFYIILDFQVHEQPVLIYNLPTRFPHPPAEKCREFRDDLLDLVNTGKFSERAFKMWETTFELFRRYFEMRHCPESVARQNAIGMIKSAKTTQDHLDITEKTNASWFRSKTPISNAESYAAIAFVADAALAFVPMTFRNETIHDHGAISSLDLSFRYHTKDFSCNEWLLHEQVTECANDGRTFSVGRIFRADGVLVATMSQMSILRPKKARAPTTKL